MPISLFWRKGSNLKIAWSGATFSYSFKEIKSGRAWTLTWSRLGFRDYQCIQPVLSSFASQRFNFKIWILVSFGTYFWSDFNKDNEEFDAFDDFYAHLHGATVIRKL